MACGCKKNQASAPKIGTNSVVSSSPAVNKTVSPANRNKRIVRREIK